ncbi:MAG: ABC transporter permease [Propionicimonas sp.]
MSTLTWKDGALGLIRRTPSLGMLLLLAVLWAVAWVVVPRFGSPDNIVNVLRQSTDLIIAALGVLFILLIAGIDMGIGSVYGLTSVVLVSLLAGGVNPAAAIAAALLVGILTGLSNGLIVEVAGVPAFITTLGMFYIAFALAQMLSAGQSLAVPKGSSFQAFGLARVGGIPVLILVTAVIIVAAWIVLNRTEFGRWVVATGSNREAARLSGIPVRLVTVSAFAIGGLLTAGAAALLTARTQTGEPTLGGSTATFEVITAAVVGGTSLFGGRGSVVGVVLGAVTIRTISNCITLLNVTPLLYQAVMGTLILLALVAESVRGRLVGGQQ